MSKGRTTINEIAGLFSSPDNIHKDMADGFELMKEHFQKKYVKKMMETVESYNEQVRKNPSAEIMLLKAWKPFIPEESQQKLDGLIEMLHSYNMLKEIREGANGIRAASYSAVDTPEEPETAIANGGRSVFASNTNTSIHHDGVYDIDEQCYVNYFARHKQPMFGNLAGMLMFMSMMGGE